ncbi:MAG: hypothetical protein ACRD1T_20275 [Acidimicrobiia bacterium]
MFESEVGEIRKLLSPGRRRRVEAEARLRPLAILDATITGEKGQPSTGDLRRVGQRLLDGTNWQDVFRGASSIEITTEGTGPSLSLRLSKKEGIPIQLVPEGTPGASVVAVKRVDELGYYSLGATGLAEKCGVSVPTAIAVVDYLGLRDDAECYKEIRIGKSIFKRYSPKTIERVKSCIGATSIEEVRRQLRSKKK